jgi:hypothetical protein
VNAEPRAIARSRAVDEFGGRVDRVRMNFIRWVGTCAGAVVLVAGCADDGTDSSASGTTGGVSGLTTGGSGSDGSSGGGTTVDQPTTGMSGTGTTAGSTGTSATTGPDTTGSTGELSASSGSTGGGACADCPSDFICKYA